MSEAVRGPVEKLEVEVKESVEKLEVKVNEYTGEMRRRSHDLGGLLQAHSAELAVMKTVAEQQAALGKAFYGDPQSGTDTGMKGVVQRLAMDIKEIELRRQQDARDNGAQYRNMIEEQQKQSSLLQHHAQQLTIRNERKKGAMTLAREIGNTISAFAIPVIGLIIAWMELHRH